MNQSIVHLSIFRTLILVLLLCFNSCKNDDFKDKGLTLLSPTAAEFKTNTYQIGDSLSLTAIYQGSEDVIYVYITARGNVLVPENSNGDGYHAYTYPEYFFSRHYFHIKKNEPFTLKWLIKDNWSPKSINPLFESESRKLFVRVVTDNHILDYQYELSAN
jgi:hypothetical protein